MEILYSNIAMSVRKKVKITNRDGIHARPSAQIVEAARNFKCTINFYKRGAQGNAANMLDLMAMAMAFGEEIEIVCHGEREKEALELMVDLFTREFNFKKN